MTDVSWENVARRLERLKEEVCWMNGWGYPMDTTLALFEQFEKNIEKAVAAERERCAQIAESLNGWGYPTAPYLAAHIAKVIRSGAR